jgi:TIR domain/YEATS family
MTLKIAQDHAYAGNDYWRWSAWLEGPADELASVQEVQWLLHPSFNPAIVSSSDRARAFRVDGSSWGTFVLRAKLRRAGGGVSSSVTLQHSLVLPYPQDAGEPTPVKVGLAPPPPQALAPSKSMPLPLPLPPPVMPPAARPRKVFLSFGAEDSRRAQALRRTLQGLNVQVVDDSQMAAGQSWEMAIRDLQAGTDATVAFVSSDTPSPFVVREVNASQQAGKPTCVIASDDFGAILGIDPAVPVAHTNPDDPSGVAAALQQLQLSADDPV